MAPAVLGLQQHQCTLPPPLCLFAFSFLSPRRIPINGFRSPLNPRRSHLEILIFITSAYSKYVPILRFQVDLLKNSYYSTRYKDLNSFLSTPSSFDTTLHTYLPPPQPSPHT